MVVKNWRPIVIMQIDKFWAMGLNTGWYQATCKLPLEDMEHIWVLTKESFTYVNYKTRHDIFRKILLQRRKGEVPLGADLTTAEM